MNNYHIGLQLYSIRGIYEKDLQKALDIAAGIGCDYVEFYGPFDKYSADEINAALEKSGLKCIGWHTDFKLLENDSLLKKTAEFNRSINNEYIIVPNMPGVTDISGWERTAVKFNEISNKLSGFGLQFGYHNHKIEFTEIDGILPWDIVFSKSKDIIMQLDMGNSLSTGFDYIEKTIMTYPGILTVAHIKPYSFKAGFDTVIGEDDIDWEKVLRLCINVGETKYFTLEIENQNIEDIKINFKKLTGLFGSLQREIK